MDEGRPVGDAHFEVFFGESLQKVGQEGGVAHPGIGRIGVVDGYGHHGYAQLGRHAEGAGPKGHGVGVEVGGPFGVEQYGMAFLERLPYGHERAEAAALALALDVHDARGPGGKADQGPRRHLGLGHGQRLDVVQYHDGIEIRAVVAHVQGRPLRGRQRPFAQDAHAKVAQHRAGPTLAHAQGAPHVVAEKRTLHQQGNEVPQGASRHEEAAIHGCQFAERQPGCGGGGCR